jgi:hypothetical protein
MSNNASRNHGDQELPSGAKLYGVVRESNYPLDIVAALAPSRHESEPQLVMERLLRECLKRERSE